MVGLGLKKMSRHRTLADFADFAGDGKALGGALRVIRLTPRRHLSLISSVVLYDKFLSPRNDGGNSAKILML